MTLLMPFQIMMLLLMHLIQNGIDKSVCGGGLTL
jgi:hypothetical protein